MILSVSELLSYPEFVNESYEILEDKLEALETLIRAYTNNNFLNRNIRLDCSSSETGLNGTSPYLKVGNTVQIINFPNEGLYVIEKIESGHIFLDKELYTADSNIVKKVEYPKAIKQGVIELMKWELNNRDKVGIKSETISRHSVTYFDMDTNNSIAGYPTSLMGFLGPYMKARF